MEWNTETYLMLGVAYIIGWALQGFGVALAVIGLLVYYLAKRKPEPKYKKA